MIKRLFLVAERGRDTGWVPRIHTIEPGQANGDSTTTLDTERVSFGSLLLIVFVIVTELGVAAVYLVRMNAVVPNFVPVIRFRGSFGTPAAILV